MHYLHYHRRDRAPRFVTDRMAGVISVPSVFSWKCTKYFVAYSHVRKRRMRKS
jgi:hypothetical protein